MSSSETGGSTKRCEIVSKVKLPCKSEVRLKLSTSSCNSLPVSTFSIISVTWRKT